MSFLVPLLFLINGKKNKNIQKILFRHTWHSVWIFMSYHYQGAFLWSRNFTSGYYFSSRCYHYYYYYISHGTGQNRLIRIQCGSTDQQMKLAVKVSEFIKNIPTYMSNLLLGVISLLSLMLLYSENRRKKAESEVDTLKTEKDLNDIKERVQDEPLDDSIDKFYSGYKDSRRK